MVEISPHGSVRIGSAATSDMTLAALRRTVIRAVLKALEPPASIVRPEERVTALVEVDEARQTMHARAALLDELAEFAESRGCRRLSIEVHDSGARRIATCVLVRRGNDSRIDAAERPTDGEGAHGDDGDPG